jgi:hypothetical protein
MEVLHRKGTSNEAGALSQRPELHLTIATAKQKLLDKDLKDIHIFLSSMSHLQVSDGILHEIQYGYALDTTFCKGRHPTVTKDSKKIQSTTKVLLNHITGMGR